MQPQRTPEEQILQRWQCQQICAFPLLTANFGEAGPGFASQRQLLRSRIRKVKKHDYLTRAPKVLRPSCAACPTGESGASWAACRKAAFASSLRFSATKTRPRL